MKRLLLLFTAFSLNLVTYAQCDIPATFSGNTGANMTVMLTPDFISSLTITDADAYVVATTDAGMVVGSQPVSGVPQTSLAVWGDDSSTPETDGALTGESINLSLVDGSNLYLLTPPSPISYVTSGMSVQMGGASPELCGAGDSDGDCTFPGFFSGNTGNNMTVMLTPGVFSGLNIVNEDAYISAISDGMLVGSVSVYGISQTALSVWGDDSSTGAVDGASIGSEVVLQLVDGSSLYTLTTSPEPITYIVNGTQVIMSASASLSCGVTEILGCTDATADNFNADATTDDGSCMITGCMDVSADNFNASANNAGDCDYSGCTNSSACNYDPIHNVEDGSCTYADSGYDCNGVCLADADGDGVCDAFEVLGCTDSNGCNYNPDATDSGFCSYPSQSYLDCSGECINDDDGDGICNELESEGCTDETAFNYNPVATDDDGSCIAVALGCLDSSADNYDASANTDNGLCQYLGCTDESAFNYDASANVNDGSCIDVVLGCMDAMALNYNSVANTDDGSCIAVVSGCTDDGAINYNSNANVDDGSCIMPAAGFEIVNSNTGNNALIYIDVNAFSFNAGDNLGAFFIDENGEEQCAGVLSWDPTGNNLIVVHGDDPNTAAIDGAHGQIIWKTNIDGQAVVLFASYGSYGLENILGNNQYAPNAAYLITGFTIAIEGCMNPGYMEYDASANVEDGSCSMLFSEAYANALSDIESLNSEIDGLEDDLFNAESSLGSQIFDLQGQLADTISHFNSELNALNTYWQDLYNLDMYNLEDSMQSVINQMQADWDAQVAGLENDLAVLNQGLLDSIASYEGQLADMQAAWDADALDYQGQLSDLQTTLDVTIADYQDQLSNLVDNHADAVSELNGQIDALQAEYDAYVISTDATIAGMQENWDAEVASMQAAWDAQVAQLNADADAAAAAASLLLSNTILSFENSLDSLEFSYENEISGINSAHNAQLEEIAYLDNLEDAAYQATIDGLNSDIVGLNSDIDGLNSDIDGLNSTIDGLNSDLGALTVLQGETQASLDHYSNPISIDLQQGWNMIGFQWQNSQDVALSLAELGNSLHLIKNNSAAVYWPEFGFNSLGTVEPGQGYQVRMYYSYDDFTFPELGEGERLEVTPQVPDWVHEMVVPTHPNDVRSLVSVVNMLGQEVNPDDVFKGEVLLYLYSDGSVEKIIK